MATKRFRSDYVLWSNPDIKIPDYSYRYDGRNSARDKQGNLVLRSNPLAWDAHCKLANREELANYGYSTLATQHLSVNPGRENVDTLTLQRTLNNAYYKRLYNNAYARLRGRLYNGSAALGVTVGTYKESRQMMVDRFNSLNQRADEAAARLATARNKHKVLASTHLEVVFGWMPLLSDIHALTTTVIGKDPLLDTTTVKGRAIAVLSHDKHELIAASTPQTSRWLVADGRYVVEIGSRVRVTNQNLWLLERAGSLNPASVAWDLVPWSFAINWFINTGQLVNSLTDFVGLTFENQYIQEKYRGMVDYHTSITRVARYERFKKRTLGSIPRPTLMTQLPDANMGLAAIAGSLFAQKASALGRIIRPLVKRW